MAKHPNCDNVRLADRCVECNPGYSDNNQAYWIYQEQQRTGAPLADVEQSYIRENTQ